jgi:hypothetical protein
MKYHRNYSFENNARSQKQGIYCLVFIRQF